MSHSLRTRLERLEGGRGALAIVHFVDGPPSETREEWLARMAAKRAGITPPISTAVNQRGETRDQWLERRAKDIALLIPAKGA